MPIKVHICVYVGEPVDSTEYRHTALFLEYADGSKCLLHIVGPPGEFKFEPVERYDPASSQKLARQIPVVEVPDSLIASSLRGLMSRTPMRNEREYADWNCHSWVSDALTRMVSNGYLTASQRLSAIDVMATVLLETKDE